MRAWIVGSIVYILLEIGLRFNSLRLLRLVQKYSDSIKVYQVASFNWYCNMGMYETVTMIEPEVCLGFWGESYLQTKQIERILKGLK